MVFGIIIFSLLFQHNAEVVSLTAIATNGTVLDLGKWNGRQHELSVGVNVKIYDFSKFDSFLKKLEEYDPELDFLLNDGKRVIYLVKKETPFVLRIENNDVRINEMKTILLQSGGFVMADVCPENQMGNGFSPNEWMLNVISFEKIDYLYKKLPEEMTKVEDEIIYLRKFQKDEEGRYVLANDYSVALYPD